MHYRALRMKPIKMVLFQFHNYISWIRTKFDVTEKKLIKSFKDLKQKVLNLKERVLQNFQGKLSSYPGGLPLHHLERQMDTGRTDHELYLKISLTRNGRLWNSNTNSVFCF